MKTFDFRVHLGSREFTKRICAENYTIASNLIHAMFPRSAIISPGLING